MSVTYHEETRAIAGKASPFQVKKKFPLNGESPAAELRQHYLTPHELFYVRHHGTIPRIDGSTHEIALCGELPRLRRYRVSELKKKFPVVSAVVTLQCAGLRRRELDDIRDVAGIAWDEGAISTGRWTGVRLADVLRDAGVTSDSRPGEEESRRDGSGTRGDDDNDSAPASRHVAFRSADSVEEEGEAFSFGGSIPLEKALSGEVLLAFELNGRALPIEHGGPLRVVVPGYLGARSVKWLAEINIQDEPSDNYFEQRAYKLFPPHVDEENVDWDQGEILGPMPVNAVICFPDDGAAVEDQALEVTGYAMSGGGRSIESVQLSIDGGRSWSNATIERQDNPWSWAFWSGRLTLPPGAAEVEIIARAWDSDRRTQPPDAERLWNFKGYYNNAWHRIRVTLAGAR